MTRMRADVLLAERGIFPSRERARAAILAGDVRVDGEPITKAGQMLSEDAEFEIAEKRRYVSRGGDKLAGALDAFSFDASGLRAVDVGASTGGFTDCLLQRGAVSVAAVDVGYGQLAWSLRNDPRVSVFERTNIRSADTEELGAPFDLVVVDVSFIGLKVVLPALLALLGDRGDLLALVKPQFEAGKGRVGKRGVVRDPAVHQEVLQRTVDAVSEAGLRVRGLGYSPIKGPEGNIEFWIWASCVGEPREVDVASVVHMAHERLTGG